MRQTSKAKKMFVYILKITLIGTKLIVKYSFLICDKQASQNRNCKNFFTIYFFRNMRFSLACMWIFTDISKWNLLVVKEFQTQCFSRKKEEKSNSWQIGLKSANISECFRMPHCLEHSFIYMARQMPTYCSYGIMTVELHQKWQVYKKKSSEIFKHANGLHF